MKNKEIVKRLKDSLDYEFDLSFNDRKQLLSYIEQLENKAELGEHYKHLYSEVRKQKDDVIKYIKHIKSILEEYNYEPYRVNTALEDLLRMLGEIDE